MNDKKKKIKSIIKKIFFILLLIITLGCWSLIIARCVNNNYIADNSPKIINQSLNRSNADINDNDIYYYDDSNINVIETGVDYHYYYFNSIMTTNYFEYYFTYSSNGEYVILDNIYLDLTGDCYYLTNVNSMSPYKSSVSISDFSLEIDTYNDTTYNTNQIVGGIIIYDRFEIELLQGCLTSNNNRFLQVTLTVYQANNTTVNYTYRYNITSDWGYGSYAPYYSTNRLPAKLSYSAKSLFVDYFTRYNEGYDNGISINDDSNIYDEGYNAGKDDGIAIGKSEVINNPNSYDLYTSQQYQNYGNSKYNEGYNENATYSLEADGFLIMFNTIMNAPLNIFTGLLNFELFGVNLFNLFTFLVSCVLCIWVIKLFV